MREASERSEQVERPPRAIGPIGTIARLGGGLALLYLPLHDGSVGRWTLLSLVLFPAALLAWQALRLHRTRAPLRATGPLGLLAHHAVLAALIVVPFTREATAVFYGVSMLLAAVRGYAGCEVLAMSNWLLGRNDQVGCLVFSPIDALERAALQKGDG